MATISLTDATPDTEIISSLVNNNNATLLGLLNGGIEDENVSTGAMLSVDKLRPGNNTESLVIVGSTPTWSRTHQTLLYQSGVTVDIVNTAAESNLLTYSLAGGTMGAEGLLRIRISGDYLQNSGSARALTIKVVLGGTTLWGDQATAIADSASRRAFHFVCDISNVNSQSAQHLNGYIALSGGNGSVAGLGSWDAVILKEAVISSAASNPSVNTAIAQSLSVTAQHSIANANMSLRAKHVLVELLRRS